MRVAITGGLGFIGSHLVDRFAGLGWDVTIIDDLSGNVVSYDVFPEAEFILNDAGAWGRGKLLIDPTRKPDLVVHAAAPVGPGLVTQVGGQIALAIMQSTHAIGMACAEHGIPLVNISSSEVYGTTLKGGEAPDESSAVGYWCGDVFTPRSEYGLAKATAEAMLENLHHGDCKLQHISVRPFNTAGPRQDSSKGFVLPTFVEQAKAHSKLTVYEPRARRSLTHVRDVCRFICDYWEAALGYSDDVGPAFNVGAHENDVTIGDLAGKVCSLHISRTGTDAQWEEANPVDRWGSGYTYFGRANGTKIPNASKARHLGWRPIYTLDDVIEHTYDHQEGT